jgi:cytidylate kinase
LLPPRKEGKEVSAVASGDTRLITVSASYGAGGSVVAPALAKRLGVPFMHRVTTSTGVLAAAGGVAAGEPCTEQLAREETHFAPAHRLFASLAHAMPAGPTQSPPSARHQDESLRRQCEEGIRQLAGTGEGVILGRAAAVALGKDRGFHVRLDGPANLRVVQGAAVEAISEDEARRHLKAADRARTDYVRHLYHVDPADSRHYHLVIDSTAIPIDAVVEVILRALSAFPSPLAAPGGR